MKVALGMICKNEEYYLSKILPIIRGSFDEFVAVDGGSTDKTKNVLGSFHCKLVERPWDFNFSNARNEVIKHITAGWCVMLVSDEAMFPKDIEKLKWYMTKTTFVYFPRYNFANDHEHYAPEFYPDRQGRAFKMGMNYHFRNPVHEILYRGNDEKSAWESGYGLKADDCHIYHYGSCKPRESTWLKHHNYGLIQKGLPVLKEFPKGFDLGPRPVHPEFPGIHPLKGIPTPEV